jgi:hypothetical protein
MTTSPLTKTELSHAYTVGGTDDAPIVDGLGNPRFLSALDFPHDDDPLYGLSALTRDAEIDLHNREAAEWAAWEDAIRRYN